MDLQLQKKISGMKEAGFLLSRVFDDLTFDSIVGHPTSVVDQKVKTLLDKYSLQSMAFGYHGFPGYSCISLNDVVVHGVPSASVIIRQDDIVKIDICVSHKGFCADMARPFYKKDLEKESIILQIVACGENALEAGFAECYEGNRLGTLSHAIENVIISKGFSVVKSFCGHGIGKKMHEEPLVPNYGIKGKGVLLKNGMGLAIEPMFCAGKADLVIDPVDKWSAKTKDRMLAGHIEDTVVVTEHELIVVTRPEYNK